MGSTYSSYWWITRWSLSYEYHYIALSGPAAATGLTGFRMTSNTLRNSWVWGSYCQPAARSRWPATLSNAPAVVVGGINHMWPYGSLRSTNNPVGFWLEDTSATG